MAKSDKEGDRSLSGRSNSQNTAGQRSTGQNTNRGNAAAGSNASNNAGTSRSAGTNRNSTGASRANASQPSRSTSTGGLNRASETPSLGGSRASAPGSVNRASGSGLGSSVNRASDGGGLARAAGLDANGRAGVPSSIANRALSPARDPRDMASISGPAGNFSVPQRTAPPTSYRQAEIKSMSDYQQMTRPSFRSTEEAAMAKENAWQDAMATIRPPEAGTTNPYNRLVTGGPEDYADLTNMTIGEVQAYQQDMRRKGHISTALGAYQFTKATLAEAVARTGLPSTAKFTKATQDYLARDLISNRAKKAQVNGQTDIGSFSNQLGNEWASFQQSDGKGAYDGDGLNTATVPHGEIKAVASGLVNSGALGDAPTQERNLGRKVSDSRRAGELDLPGTGVAPVPSTTRAQAFADKYLSGVGAGRPAGPVSSNVSNKQYQGPTPSRELMSDQEIAAVQGETPAAINVPAVRDSVDLQQAPSITPIREAVPSSSTPAPSAPPPSSINPVDDRQAVTPVVSTPVAPTDDTEDAPLTTGQKVAAAGIDVGLGMIPGVGLAATVVNGIAALTGRPTIGQMAIDFLGDGSPVGNNEIANRESGQRRYFERPQEAKDEGQKEKPPERFKRKYLAPPQPYRPKPSERWRREPV